MKILIDQNISFKVKYALNQYFPGTWHVSDVGLADKSDEEIWMFAKTNGFAILTCDIDFFDMSLLKNSPPKVVRLSGSNLSTKLLID